MKHKNIRRRKFIKNTGIAAASLTIPQLNCSRKQTQDRPNILFIMADDHAANAISSYGSRLAEFAPTAHIDRIGAEGARLSNCFCTNSICVPSRATILTGQYSHVNGVYTLRDSLDPDDPNVAKMMQRSGYETAIIGKWHLKNEPSGFDYWNVLPGQGRYHNPILKEKNGKNRTYEGFCTDVITDLTLDWLQNRQSNQPFFLMTHFKNSHEPWHYAERHKSLYRDVHIPEPASLWEDKSHRSPGSKEYGFTIDTMASRQERADHPTGTLDTSGMSSRERRKAAYQKLLKDYLRCIAAIDENVGKILDYLDQNNLAENTVVIYTSDQGYFLGEHNYIDKRWMYEESIQMPFLIRYPQEIKPGTVVNDLIINTDFAPTFLDYAGKPIPELMQGRSFRPNLVEKTPMDWRTSMYYRYWMHCSRPAHYGIRTRRYKLIFFYGLSLDATGALQEPTKPGWELYDLQKDPKELHNVYNDPTYTDVVKRLKKELFVLKKELGDTDDKYPELMALRKQFE